MFLKSLKTADQVLSNLRDYQTADRLYFSTLATILHTWRDTAKEMKRIWADEFGHESAFSVFRTRAPQPISGRWGSVAGCEDHVLRIKGRRLQHVSSIAWAKATSQAKAKLKPVRKANAKLKAVRVAPKAIPKVAAAIVPANIDGTTELAIDTIAAHRVRKTKYRQAALCAVHDPVFMDLIVQMLHDSREPLQHFFHWLEQPCEDILIDMERRCPGKMAQLVWGKAEAFTDEFLKLTRLENWNGLLDSVPASLANVLAENILMITLQHHADFVLRVGSLVKQEPWRCFIIAKRSRYVSCEERQAYCSRVLDMTGDGELHWAILLLKRSFRASSRSRRALSNVLLASGSCWTYGRESVH